VRCPRPAGNRGPSRGEQHSRAAGNAAPCRQLFLAGSLPSSFQLGWRGRDSFLNVVDGILSVGGSVTQFDALYFGSFNKKV